MWRAMILGCRNHNQGNVGGFPHTEFLLGEAPGAVRFMCAESSVIPPPKRGHSQVDCILLDTGRHLPVGSRDTFSDDV